MPSYSVWFLTRPGSCHPISAASGGTQALNPGFQAFLALHGPTERQSEIWGVAEEKCAALCMEWPGCTAYEYKLGRWFVPPGPAPFFGPQGARGKWIGKGHASRCSIFNSDVSCRNR